jgi:hypothetical protein
VVAGDQRRLLVMGGDQHPALQPFPTGELAEMRGAAGPFVPAPGVARGGGEHVLVAAQHAQRHPAAAEAAHHGERAIAGAGDDGARRHAAAEAG